MSKKHDRTKRKTIDIDMNDLLEIDDSTWELILKKFEHIDSISDCPVDFIKSASKLDFGQKEMFLVGFMIRDYL